MSLDKPRLLAELLDRHGAALALFARQWDASADDVVQEALIELAALVEWPRNPVAWLFDVVRKRAISHARSTARRRRHESLAAGAWRDWFKSQQRHDADAEFAADALASLPLELREVVVAHLWGGLTFAEIGELTKTSSSSAHRRFETAVARLREKLNVELPCPTKPNPTT
jgi:RNA polymerase sigma-70 factor (ECF subfamily)